MIHRLFSTFFLVVCGVLCSHAQAEDDAKSNSTVRTQKVVAEGVGVDAKNALNDAFRNAVRQVVGAVIDAKTIVKDDEIIEDKILTFSAGFIKTYTKLSERQRDGLFRVKIEATVDRSNLIAKLKAANVTMKAVYGKGLFAEIVTKLDAEKGARALIEKTLEGFPLNCVQATVDGKPELVSKNSDKATVRITIKYQADRKAYSAFSKRLLSTLERLAKSTAETSLIAERHPKYLARGFQFDLRKGGVRYSQVFSDVLQRDKSDLAMIAVNDLTTASFGRTHWKCFFVDRTKIGRAHV